MITAIERQQAYARGDTATGMGLLCIIPCCFKTSVALSCHLPLAWSKRHPICLVVYFLRFIISLYSYFFCISNHILHRYPILHFLFFVQSKNICLTSSLSEHKDNFFTISYPVPTISKLRLKPSYPVSFISRNNIQCTLFSSLGVSCPNKIRFLTSLSSS